MTEFQWKVVKALCVLFLAHIRGEKFDSVEAAVQYREELNLLEDAVRR